MSTAFPRNLRTFFGIVVSLLTLALSFLQSPSSPTGVEMPVTPEDFVPAIRFVVCSDTHSYNDRVAEMIDTSYALFDNDETYPGIDLFCFCGDVTGVGLENELDAFKSTLDEHIKGDTEAFVILGNHELKNKNSPEYYEKIFGLPRDRSIKVNGFNFIGVSNRAAGYFPVATQNWLEDELDKALKDTPELPIFTFQHPHNSATVYGSITWGMPLFARIYNPHSQVVNFSGHSHFPMNDPRSIWQGGYTALGCGAMKYLELERDLLPGHHPDGYDPAKQFYFVEADLDGSVRVRCYDLISNGFFGEEYYIEDVNDKSTFAYTYKNRMQYDDAPVFPENATATLEKQGKDWILTFDKAQDKLNVHDYKIEITVAGVPVYIRTLLSDYYLVNDSTTQSYNLGFLPITDSEHCTVSITAVNCYYELSEPLVVKL